MLFNWGDVNLATHRGGAVKVAFALVLKGDYAAGEGKKGVVLAKADIEAREHAGAALAHDNIALLGNLAGIELNAKVFCLGVIEVFSCSARFFTCHK